MDDNSRGARMALETNSEVGRRWEREDTLAREEERRQGKRLPQWKKDDTQDVRRRLRGNSEGSSQSDKSGRNMVGLGRYPLFLWWTHSLDLGRLHGEVAGWFVGKDLHKHFPAGLKSLGEADLPMSD